MYLDGKNYSLIGIEIPGTIEIDDLIAPAVSMLNKKGYMTSACCSGHADSTHRPEYAYIQFDDYLRPEILPHGWYWDDDCMRHEYAKYPAELLEQEINGVMQALSAWAEALPDGK